MAIAGIVLGIVGLLSHIVSTFCLPAEYAMLSTAGIALIFIGVFISGFSIVANIENIRMTKKNISKKSILTFVSLFVCILSVVLYYVIHK